VSEVLDAWSQGHSHYSRQASGPRSSPGHPIRVIPLPSEGVGLALPGHSGTAIERTQDEAGSESGSLICGY